MAKKNIKEKPKTLPVAAPWYKTGKQLALIISLLVVTFLCFSPVLSGQKEFINFDDPVYITQQNLITKMDAKHLKTMFSEPDGSLNYHPVTMLSLAVNYYFSQLHPFGYFFTNLLIHLLNTFLVFLFLYRLSGKHFWTGFIAAALFGIHPMHVESVAWAAERKDVLYCCFFLLSCITYLDYFETKKLKYLVICFVLFLLSCLSKAMAVPLPMVLLLIDYYKGRRFALKSITEKAPFFLVSFIIGFIAIKVQSHGAMTDLHHITILERFMYASYGFMMYFEKLAAPFHLSAFYSYPVSDHGHLDLIYKVAPVVAAAILIVPLFIAYKKSETKFRIWFFGMGFFILMIALVLQLLSVGGAIMADRYSYLPYIGIFFIIGSYFNQYIEKAKTRNVTAAALFVIVISLSVACYARVKVWQNDEVLWSDVIDKYPPVTENVNGVLKFTLPEGTNIAYDNRANYYRLRGEMDKAYADYEILTRFHSTGEGAYNNLANIYSMKAGEAAGKGKQQEASEFSAKAITMYSEALRLSPNNADAAYNRGITYSNTGDHKKALEDFERAMVLKPDEPSILASAANEDMQLGMYKESIENCTHGLVIKPEDPMLLFYRGTAYINSNKYNEGIADLTQAVKINPLLGNAWYNLSFAYSKINNKQQALDAAYNAKKNGYPITDQYLESLKK